MRKQRPALQMGFLSPPPLLTSHLRASRYRRQAVCASYDGGELPALAYTRLPKDDIHMCRIVNGIYGELAAEKDLVRAIDATVDQGFCTFDLAECCGDAELGARAYRKLVGRVRADGYTQFFTKLTLSPNTIPVVNRRTVESYVDATLQRTGQEQLCCMQLHWSDFEDLHFIDILGHLCDLKRDGKLRSVGLVDFPTRIMRFVRSQSIPFVSNQVSFSVLDQRPLVEMAEWCAANETGLLAYSTLGGGFISERFLGVPEPTQRACGTQSLSEFLPLIRVWGGWSLFQELLYSLEAAADKHNVTIANVAVRWVLQQKGVSAVILGSRLGLGPQTDHTDSNKKLFDFELDQEDLQRISAVTLKGNDLYRLLGD